MKTKILFFLVFFFLISFGKAQVPTIQWEKSLGGSGTGEIAWDIQQTTDNGYIVAGQSDSNDGDITGNHGSSDFWISKLNSSGNIIWQKSFGGSNSDYAKSIQQTSDGGYVVAGLSYSNDGDVTGNHGGSDYWVIKLDSTGNIIWSKSYGGSNDETLKSIQQTTDGGYIIAGYSFSNNGDVTGNHGISDYWIVKIDLVGNIIWQKSIGVSNSDFSSSIKQTTDGGYIVGGYSHSNDFDVSGHHNAQDFWVVKLDILGNIVWQKSLGGDCAEQAYYIQQTTDGGYIVAGDSCSNDGDVTGNHGGNDCWIVKLDSSGNIIWQKSLGGNLYDGANSMQQTLDGGYIIAGLSYSNTGDVTGNHGGGDYWIIKIDSLGNIIWQKTFGGTGADYPYAIHQTLDGGYIIAGYSDSNDGDVTGNHGGYDFWVVKLGVNNDPCAWKEIASQGSHTLAIKQDGTLWATGQNNEGQLGDGTLISKNVFTQIGSSNNWKKVSVGYSFSTALKSDGTLWAWGKNDVGQLGNLNNTSSLVPILVNTDNDWVDVSAGAEHVIALKSNGTLWSWGNNVVGELGIGNYTNQNFPHQIGIDTDWQTIATGYYHSMAIKSNHSLWTFGSNIHGQLGNGSSSQSTIPVKIGNNDWAKISGGYAHSKAIKTDGTLWSWGRNIDNELGNGSTADSYIPIQIGTNNNWNKISAGGHFTYATDNNNNLYAWGLNLGGELGNGTLTNSGVPILVFNDNSTFYISTGYYQGFLLKNSNYMWATGIGYSGQLGLGTNTMEPSFKLLSCTNLSAAETTKKPFSIYPNPTKDKIYFKDLKNISKVNIYDVQGRLVKTAISKDNYTDLSQLNKGIYFVEIFSNGKSYKTKVVKE